MQKAQERPVRGFLLRGLKQHREGAMVSQRELAKKSGVTQSTIWELETLGRGANPRTVRKLADALGVTVEDLRSSPEK